jgi:hypothetical protein
MSGYRRPPFRQDQVPIMIIDLEELLGVRLDFEEGQTRAATTP